MVEEDKDSTEGVVVEGTTSEMRGLSNNLLKAGRVDSRILGRMAEGTVVGDVEVAEEVNEVVGTFRVSVEVVGGVVVVDDFLTISLCGDFV